VPGDIIEEMEERTPRALTGNAIETTVDDETANERTVGALEAAARRRGIMAIRMARVRGLRRLLLVGLSEPMDLETRYFFVRPVPVVPAERLSDLKY